MTFVDALFWTAVAVCGLYIALVDDIRYYLESRKNRKQDDFSDVVLYQDEWLCPLGSKEDKGFFSDIKSRRKPKK